MYRSMKNDENGQSGLVQGDQLMGDQGTSDTALLHSSFGIQRRDQFQGQALHMRDSDLTSIPIFSNNLHRQAGVLQPADHHPAVTSRHDGHEEWSNRACPPASGPLTGHRDWSENEIQLMEWRRRGEQGLAKGASSFSDQSRLDMHEDRWSARPTTAVSAGDWERKHQHPDISLGGRFAAFQDGPWFQPGGMNSAVAPQQQQQQQLEALKSQEIASEWDRWRAHGARQDWLSGRQSSKHNVTTSDEPTSTTPDHNQAHVHFKKLLDHSCSSSNIQEKQQQYPQQRTWENEVPHCSSSWPAMFGAPDPHTAQRGSDRYYIESRSRPYMESEADMGSPWAFMVRRQDQVEQAAASTRSNMDRESNSTTLSLYPSSSRSQTNNSRSSNYDNKSLSPRHHHHSMNLSDMNEDHDSNSLAQSEGVQLQPPQAGIISGHTQA